MVKFGKEFRKIKIEAWKDKYIDYKALKQIIKKNKGLKHQNFLNVDERSKIALQKAFISVLDKELKRMYLFFVKNERDLYLSINTHVHARIKYHKMTNDAILNEIVKLETLSIQTLELTKFIIDNMTALKKILKKFDKNFGQLLGAISYDYISSKLATKSDLLYIFRFKIVDEVSAILDDLLDELKQYYNNDDDDNAYNESNDKAIKKEKELLKLGLLVNEEESHESSSERDKNSSRAKGRKNKFNSIRSNITTSLRTIDELISKFKIYFKHWSKFLKSSSKKKGNSEVFLEKEDEEASHERRETINMNISTVASYDFFEIIIPSNENVMTKANKANILITFLYTFIVCLCYTTILPNNAKSDIIKDNPYQTGIVIAMTPLGCIVALSYELIWIKLSFKQSLILSCFFLFVGNFLYLLSFYLHNLTPMLIGRFCIGLGTARNSNRSYLINYVPKICIKRILFRYKLLIMVASFIGPSIVIPIALTHTSVTLSDFTFDEFTIPTLICLILSLIEFVIILSVYKEPFNPKFVPYSNYDEGEDFQTESGEINFNNRKTVNNINDKIQEINVKQRYNDSNQVSIAIEDIMHKEANSHQYIFKAFLFTLVLTFLCNFSSEFAIVYAAIFLNELHSSTLDYNSVVFTGVFFAILVFRLFNWKVLSTRMSDNKCLLLFLFIIPATCFIIYIPIQPKVVFYVVFSIIAIDTQLLFDTVQHLFIRIIPFDYSLKKLLAVNYVKFMAEFSKALGCFVILIGCVDLKYMTEIVLGIIIGLFALVGIVVFIVRNELREKSICRILRSRATRKFNAIEF